MNIPRPAVSIGNITRVPRIRTSYGNGIASSRLTQNRNIWSDYPYLLDLQPVLGRLLRHADNLTAVDHLSQPVLRISKLVNTASNVKVCCKVVLSCIFVKTVSNVNVCVVEWCCLFICAMLRVSLTQNAGRAGSGEPAQPGLTIGKRIFLMAVALLTTLTLCTCSRHFQICITRLEQLTPHLEGVIDTMLYLVGLGLADETDITVKGLEIVKRAERVYLEAYTSILLVGKEKLVSVI